MFRISCHLMDPSLSLLSILSLGLFFPSIAPAAAPMPLAQLCRAKKSKGSRATTGRRRSSWEGLLALAHAQMGEGVRRGGGHFRMVTITQSSHLIGQIHSMSAEHDGRDGIVEAEVVLTRDWCLVLLISDL